MRDNGSGRSGRGRILSRGEHELWTVVTADVRPFRARTVAATPEPAPAAAPPPAPVAPATLGAGAPAPQRDRPKPPAPLVDLDHRTRTKLRRGRLDVDAKLDLHGMRQAEAQRALHDFLHRAQSAGAKIAIVVTGKGLGREEGGVLRRLAPLWLQAPYLRDIVVGFGEAAHHHGGEGALYVRIRRAGRHSSG